MIEKTCIRCGEKYSVPEYRNKTTKYCSRKCKNVKHLIECNCVICGKPYLRKRSEAGPCCSWSCAGKKGEKHFAGHNGIERQIDDNGYAKVFSPYHPLAVGGRVRESHLVAFEVLGIRLKKGEVLHHIDENRLNNNHDNLKVMTRGEHTRWHVMDRLDRGVYKFPRHDVLGRFYSPEPVVVQPSYPPN
jgi:hypothetical protein